MKIHGIKILDFPCGKMEIKEHCCDFYISDDIHSFDITVDEDDYCLEKGIEIEHKEYLFCVDGDGIYFTLYDCYITPVQIPVKQVKIIWNKCLWGYHIENLKDEKISSSEYIIQTKKYPCHMFFGKYDFDVNNGEAHVSIDWNQVNNRIDGVVINVTFEESKSIELAEKMIIRLLEIFSLINGFFSEIKSCKMTTESKKSYYFIKNFIAYGKTTESNIKLPYVFDIKNTLSLSMAYDAWWKLREIEVETFNLFSYLSTEKTPVREVPIATCIQCLEGYFRSHHSDSLLIFSDVAKEQIVEEVSKLLKESDDLLKICEEHEVDMEYVISKYVNMSGHINEYSLKELLKFAIGRCGATKKLFEYERATKVNNDKTVMDLFIQKSTGHRNWLSHLKRQNRSFTDNEIELAVNKLKLLFRLTLLHDIRIEVTDTSLDRVVDVVNQWYKSNQLK